VRQPRSRAQQWKDAVTFPMRAFVMFGGDRWGLSALFTERYEFAAAEVQGHCLDVGCGPHDRFVRQFLGGRGAGIDVFPYAGLTAGQLMRDPRHFPFADGTFDTVTFNACFNHIPKSLRDVEVAEAARCLRPGGNIVITMGNPAAELAVHGVLWLYDRVLGTKYDLDHQRGMHAEESYYVRDSEIAGCLTRNQFVGLRKKHFWTQWGLNHLFVAWKPPGRTEAAR